MNLELMFLIGVGYGMGLSFIVGVWYLLKKGYWKEQKPKEELEK